jgi:hypothetical protein
MHMPQPGEHHKKLAALAGEWVGQETLHVTPFNPTQGSATSRTTARLDLDGFFLISDYVQSREGRVSYRGHGILGYDNRQEHYTFRWFDVMGSDPGAPAVGHWKGDALQLQHQHHMGYNRYTYRVPKDGSYTFKLEMSQDGREWFTFLEGTYRRA